jgi:hypothetical protein
MFSRQKRLKHGARRGADEHQGEAQAHQDLRTTCHFARRQARGASALQGRRVDCNHPGAIPSPLLRAPGAQLHVHELVE